VVQVGLTSLDYIGLVWFMLFSTTFNDISVVSWRLVYWWRKPKYPE